MTVRTYSQPNLGPGDQWAREVQKDLTQAQLDLSVLRQSLRNQIRVNNTHSSKLAGVYAEIQDIIQVSSEGVEGAMDLANRISQLESAVRSVSARIPLVSAQADTAANFALPSGDSFPMQLSFEVPPGAKFANLVVTGSYSYSATVATNTVHALRLQGSDVVGSLSRAQTGTGLREGTLHHASHLAVDNVSTVVLGVRVNSSVAVAAAATSQCRLSAQATFTF